MIHQYSLNKMAVNMHDPSKLTVEYPETNTTDNIRNSIKSSTKYSHTNTEDNIRNSRKQATEYSNTNTEEDCRKPTSEYDHTNMTDNIHNSSKSSQVYDQTNTVDNIHDSRNLNAENGETTSLLRRSSSTKYRLVYVSFLSSFAALGSFLFGYHVAIVSGSMLFITNTYSLTTIWHSMIVSATIASAVIFSIFAGILSDRFGRKPVLLSSAFLFNCGAITMAVSDGKGMLLAGRVFIGMGVGFASMCVPVYIVEIAPPNKRGILTTLNQLFITIGILISSIIAGIFSPNGWRYMLGLPTIVSGIYFFGIFFLPETPRYLMAEKLEEKARIELERLRGTSQIDDELRDIANDVRDHSLYASNNFATNLKNMLKTPTTRSALIFGSLLAFFSQFCGINAIIYYSGSILRMAGYSSESAIWLSCFPYLINVFGTVIGMVLIEKIGRRPLTLFSILGVIIALIILAVGFHLSATSSPPVSYIEGNDTCNTYKNCEACINHDSCGFCYEKDQVHTSGSCLPVSETHPDRYADPNKYSYRCNETNYNTETSKRKYEWIYQFLCPSDYMSMVVVGLVMFTMAFSPGIGPNCWTINAEIYPLWARSTGNSINTSINWIGNFIVTSFFLTLTETITVYGTFYLFTGITTTGFFVMFFMLPETKGITLEEVEELFADSCTNKLCGCGFVKPTNGNQD